MIKKEYAIFFFLHFKTEPPEQSSIDVWRIAFAVFVKLLLIKPVLYTFHMSPWKLHQATLYTIAAVY